ncbi:PHP domain-containing protein [Acidaminobacter hydrogenoformans]|nr:PHP domain-containing protein [Acidaminobacter hydrogenoformans]
MKFDLHIHELTHSKDSHLSLEQIVLEAKSRGLEGIAITDHDVLGLRAQARFLSARHNLPIFVGVEVYTTLGDILVFGVDQLPAVEEGKRIESQQLIDYVNSKGGATIAAHPFRSNGRGLGEALYGLTGLTAIEGYNGRTTKGHNDRAADVALALGIPMTGGSDAHAPGEVGAYATEVSGVVQTEKDLIQALKKGRCYPVSMTGLPLGNVAGLGAALAADVNMAADSEVAV